MVLYAGAGRIAIPLAQQELRVLAVEPDEAKRRVGEARSRKTGLEIHWQEGDAGTFELPRMAGMMIIAEHAFQRLLAHEAQQTALRRVYENLQVGGKLALSLAVPDVRELAAGEGKGQGSQLRQLSTTVDSETCNPIYRWASYRYNLVEQHISSHIIYEMVDAGGVTLRRWHRTSELAYIWPRQMRLLLEWAGFEVEALYGGWNDEPFMGDSTGQIWVARKAIRSG
ncbi:MAG TPA: class I SAM-dependent methyltransferase [Ardenticatenaceae bacterium]